MDFALSANAILPIPWIGPSSASKSVRSTDFPSPPLSRNKIDSPAHSLFPPRAARKRKRRRKER